MQIDWRLYCICLRSCCIGLETRMIIKISTHPCYSRHFANSQYFFQFQGLVLWLVSRIDWYRGHWCGSTYMVLRLFNILKVKNSLKSQKMPFLPVFELMQFCSLLVKVSFCAYSRKRNVFVNTKRFLIALWYWNSMTATIVVRKRPRTVGHLDHPESNNKQQLIAHLS